MSKRALIAEMRAAAASMVTAIAAAENEDWPTAEKAAEDCQQRGARIVRDFGLLQLAIGPVRTQPE